MRKEKLLPKYEALNAKVLSNIKFRRDMIGLKQGELAELLGVSQQNYSEYERGYRFLHPALLLQVSHSLSCTVNDLYDGCNIQGRKFKIKEIPVNDLTHRAKDLAVMFDKLPTDSQEHYYCFERNSSSTNYSIKLDVIKSNELDISSSINSTMTKVLGVK